MNAENSTTGSNLSRNP